MDITWRAAALFLTSRPTFPAFSIWFLRRLFIRSLTNIHMMKSFLYAAGLSQLARSAAALPLAAQAASVSAATCNGTFNAITAQQFVDALNPGWNLGNTLDAVEDEGDWNNAPVTEDTFDDVKAAGFKGIRLPGKHWKPVNVPTA